MLRTIFLTAAAALLLGAMPADAGDLSACVRPNGKVVWGPCKRPRDREVPIPTSTSFRLNFVVAAEDGVRPRPECPAPGCGGTPIEGAPFRPMFEFGGFEFDIACEEVENLEVPEGFVRAQLRAVSADTVLMSAERTAFGQSSSARFMELDELGIFTIIGLRTERTYVEFFPLARDIVVIWSSVASTDLATRTCFLRGWVEMVELPEPTILGSAE